MTNVSAIDKPMHHRIELPNKSVSLVIAQLRVMLKSPKLQWGGAWGRFHCYRLGASGGSGSEVTIGAKEQRSYFSRSTARRAHAEAPSTKGLSVPACLYFPHTPQQFVHATSAVMRHDPCRAGGTYGQDRGWLLCDSGYEHHGFRWCDGYAAADPLSLRQPQ